MTDKPKKNYIHIINSEILPIVEELGFNYTDSMNEALDELRSKLQLKGIDYCSLRRPLSASANVFAYVFDADKLATELHYCNYISFLITKSADVLDNKINCIFLGGDLVVEKYNCKAYKMILNSHSVDNNLLNQTTICAIAIIGITKNVSMRIYDVLKQIDSFLFYSDITKPNIEKYALTYCLKQFNIKYKNNIIYSVPEPGDTANYSGIVENLNRYNLCPIDEFLYNVFLTARPYQIYAPFSELSYTIRMFCRKKTVSYPKIVINDEKIKYINNVKKIPINGNQAKELIEKSIRTNQIFHIAPTGFGDEDCIDLNIPINFENHLYDFGLKWNLKTNEILIITLVPN